MKKKYLLVLVGQSIIILLILMYSFVQKAEAEKLRELAEELARKGREMEKKAVEMEIKYEKLIKECTR